MTYPQTMQAVEITQPGGPDVLSPVSLPVPAPGERQVLMKVAAAGVNRPDCLQRSGLYPVPADASPLPGLEVSGVIVAIGSDVNELSVGDRVCALVHGGGYAEYCLAEQGHCLAVPESLDFDSAAALPETLFTVHYNLIDRCSLGPSDTVLIHGGSSGIGSTAIQLAKCIGARVVTTAGSAEKLAFCAELGADLYINYKSEDFAEVIDREFGGVDVILDMVGGEYIQKNIDLLNRDGRYAFIAFLGGPNASVNFLNVLRNRLTINGSTLRPQSVAEKTSLTWSIAEQSWPWVLSGALRPHLFARFPLADAAKAHSLMESGQHMGKIILTVSDSIEDSAS